MSLHVILLPKECGGAWLLTVQKPISRPGWWKGKFALFQMLATVVVDVCPKADSPTLATSGARAFIDGSGGGDYMHKQHSQL